MKIKSSILYSSLLILGGNFICNDSEASAATRYALLAQKKLAAQGLNLSINEVQTVKNKALENNVNGTELAKIVERLKTDLAVANPSSTELNAAMYSGMIMPNFSIEVVKATEALQVGGNSTPNQLEIEAEMVPLWFKALKAAPTPDEIKVAKIIDKFTPVFVTAMDIAKINVALKLYRIYPAFNEAQMDAAMVINGVGEAINEARIKAILRLKDRGVNFAAIRSDDVVRGERLINLGFTGYQKIHEDALDHLHANLGVAFVDITPAHLEVIEYITNRDRVLANTIHLPQIEDGKRLKTIGFDNFSLEQEMIFNHIKRLGIGPDAISPDQINSIERLLAEGVNIAVINEKDMNAEIRFKPLRDIMFRDAVQYGELNTRDKIDKVLDFIKIRFPDLTRVSDNEILAFARKVNSEPLHRADGAKRIDNQIKALLRAIKILKKEYPTKNIETISSGEWDSVIDTRQQISLLMADIALNPTDSIEFNNMLADLMLKIGVVDKASGIDLSTAIKIYRFDRNFAGDLGKFEHHFKAKMAAMDDALVKGAAKPNLAGRPGNPNGYSLGANGAWLDLIQDKLDVITEIDRIASTKLADPIHLNYQGLTYKNYASKLFDMNYTFTPKADIEAIKTEMLSFVNEMADAANPAAEANLRNEIINKMKKISDDNRNDKWRSRVKALWDITAKKVDPAIDGPMIPGYNVLAWENALRAEKILMTQNILGAVENCNTGINTKLSYVEAANRAYLECITADIKFISPIASIIQGIMQFRIREAGKNPDVAHHYEENITAPHILFQRLRAPLGLLGNYEDVVAGVMGLPDEAKNRPVQIVRNIFLAGQPDRPYDTNTGIVNVPIQGKPLTVKTLVNEVYAEFGHSITKSMVDEFVQGNLDLYRQSTYTALMFTDTVFSKAPANALSRNPQDWYTRSTAFAMLEKLGYIQIDAATKTSLYAYDETTDEVGKAMINGHRRSLDEAIDLF